MNANASAVIIFDNEPNKMPLFMHHDVENAVAIFITKEFGDRIVTLLENETKVAVRINIGLEVNSMIRGTLNG
jgi:phosphate starvation-inducible membrane PsiE